MSEEAQDNFKSVPMGCPVGPIRPPETSAPARQQVALVIVGGRLLGVDGRPNAALAARCRCVARKFHEGRFNWKIVVLTGGQKVLGREQPTEAAVMKELLVQLGDPEGRIYMEP